MSLAGCVTATDVRAAAGVLAGRIVRTQAVRSPALERATGAAAVVLKLEPLQVTGAFKYRGAMHAMLRLVDRDGCGGAHAGGVVAYSSGNHARAVATAAAELGLKAVIVMPSDAPAAKRAGTAAAIARAAATDCGRGSRVVQYDPRTDIREEIGRRIAAEEGLTLIPPYDDPAVIAGQGTAGLELCEQAEELGVGPLDEVYVCCGGGGLLSGVATAVKDRWPGCRMIGVEPELANDARRSFESGVLHVVKNPRTIADGTRTPFLGRHTFPIVLDRVDAMMDVTEGEIAAAVRLCLSDVKVVVEPSGALGVAGLVRAAAGGARAGVRVGVLVSGGNADFERLARICSSADEIARPGSE